MPCSTLPPPEAVAACRKRTSAPRSTSGSRACWNTVHPDAGVVRQTGLGRGPLRLARQGGEDRAQPLRDPVGILLADHGEPEQSGGERRPVGRTPCRVAEEIGDTERQNAQAPRASVGQGEAAEHLLGRPRGLRAGEPFQNARVGFRALGLPEDEVGAVLGPRLCHRIPVAPALPACSAGKGNSLGSAATATIPSGLTSQRVLLCKALGQAKGMGTP
ncbi:hypothetical protein SBADM41S_05741 [Streptomyces badius]